MANKLTLWMVYSVDLQVTLDLADFLDRCLTWTVQTGWAWEVYLVGYVEGVTGVCINWGHVAEKQTTYRQIK